MLLSLIAAALCAHPDPSFPSSWLPTAPASVEFAVGDELLSPELAQGPVMALAGWRARAEDNIVGLRDPKKLSNPAKVDYPALMALTAEMKRIKREGIDESSPEGIQLRNRAASKVASACEHVMNADGHCSVWKGITHSDSRTVVDLTTKVKRRL